MSVVDKFMSSAHGFDGGNWYVVHHKPNAEQIAIRNLVRQNVRVFVPFEMAVRNPPRVGAGTAKNTLPRVSAGKTRELRKPLFPGYLFVSFGGDDLPWRAVNSTFGVLRLVSFGQNIPAAVPDVLMQHLRSRCDASGRLLPPVDLQPGEEVLVVDGALANFVGTVEKIDPQQRVWLLMNFMGRETRVKVDATNVKRFRNI